MPINGRFYHVRFAISLVSRDFFLISFLIKLLFAGEMMDLCEVACQAGFSEALSFTSSRPMVKTQRDFGLCATGPRLLAQPVPLKALARTGLTVEKRLLSSSSPDAHELHLWYKKCKHRKVMHVHQSFVIRERRN